MDNHNDLKLLLYADPPLLVKWYVKVRSCLKYFLHIVFRHSNMNLFKTVIVAMHTAKSKIIYSK